MNLKKIKIYAVIQDLQEVTQLIVIEVDVTGQLLTL